MCWATVRNSAESASLLPRENLQDWREGNCWEGVGLTSVEKKRTFCKGTTSELSRWLPTACNALLKGEAWYK